MCGANLFLMDWKRISWMADGVVIGFSGYGQVKVSQKPKKTKKSLTSNLIISQKSFIQYELS
jgi:hypothetical protein